MARQWSPGGLRLFELLPAIYSLDDPVAHAALDPLGRELDRIEALAQRIREHLLLNIADEDTFGFLAYWEAVFRLPSSQATPLTVAQRVARALAAFRARSVASGAEWVAALTEAVNAPFTYHEEDGNVVRLILPFSTTPGSPRFEYVRGEVAKITPAHLDVIYESALGWIVGQEAVGGAI